MANGKVQCGTSVGIRMDCLLIYCRLVRVTRKGVAYGGKQAWLVPEQRTDVQMSFYYCCLKESTKYGTMRANV